MNNNPYEPFEKNENTQNGNPYETYYSQTPQTEQPLKASPQETAEQTERHASQQSFYTPQHEDNSYGSYSYTESVNRTNADAATGSYGGYGSTDYVSGNNTEPGNGYTAPTDYTETQSTYGDGYYSPSGQAQGETNNYDPYTGMYTQQSHSDTAMTVPYGIPPEQGGNKNKKQKKEKKKAGRGFVTSVVAIGVLASGVLGFGGGWLANNLGESGILPSDGLTIQKVVNTAAGATQNEGDAMTTEQIAEKTANSVVEITTEVVKTGSFSQQYIESGAGSGVIVSENGYIITNNHVISGASKITVTLKNGKSYTAKLIGSASPVVDVALLKIEESGLTPVVLGDSDDIKVGEKTVVIGNPLGQLGGTVTDGIVSALNRDLSIDGVSMNLLQTNAAINPGNSGGGMFNTKGELIGLVVAKSTGSEVEGLGFAIPVNQVTDVLDDLTKYGYVKGQVDLGMSMLDITSEQMAMMYGVSETGVYVLSVNQGSNAATAGFQRGDRIVSINGTEVNSSAEVNKLLKTLKVGDTVKVKVSRNGQSGDLSFTLEESVPAASDSDGGSQNGNSNGFGDNGDANQNGNENGGGYDINDFLNSMF